jgi:hypothetical protein
MRRLAVSIAVTIYVIGGLWALHLFSPVYFGYFLAAWIAGCYCIYTRRQKPFFPKGTSVSVDNTQSPGVAAGKTVKTLKQEQEEARQRARRRDRFERAVKPTCIIVISVVLLWAWVRHQEHYRHAYYEEAVLRSLRDRAKHAARAGKLIEEAELKVENGFEAQEAMRGTRPSAANPESSSYTSVTPASPTALPTPVTPIIAPPTWKEVIADAKFKTFSPEKQLVIFSRWHDNAYNYARSLPDWEQNQAMFNDATAKGQAYYEKQAGMSLDEARLKLAQQAVRQGTDPEDLPPDLKAAYTKPEAPKPLKSEALKLWSPKAHMPETHFARDRWNWVEWL